MVDFITATWPSLNLERALSTIEMLQLPSELEGVGTHTKTTSAKLISSKHPLFGSVSSKKRSRHLRWPLISENHLRWGLPTIPKPTIPIFLLCSDIEDPYCEFLNSLFLRRVSNNHSGW